MTSAPLFIPSAESRTGEKMQKWMSQTIKKSSIRKSGWINAGSSVTTCSLGWRALWITKAGNRNRQTLPAVTAANYVQPCWNICSVLFHKLTAPPVTFDQNVEPIRNFNLHDDYYHHHHHQRHYHRGDDSKQDHLNSAPGISWENTKIFFFFVFGSWCQATTTICAT